MKIYKPQKQEMLIIRDSEDWDNLLVIMIDKQDLKKAKREIEDIRKRYADEDFDCCLKELLENEMTIKYTEVSYYGMYL